MLANILILLIVLALTVGAGWLTVRAVRAGRLWVKIAGGLGAGLLTLVLAAVTLAGGRGIAILYFPGAKPAPDLKVAGTPEQIARGQYLAEVNCVGCHGQVDASGKPTGAFPLSGGYNIGEDEGFGFIGQVAVENLTPAGKLVNYSDGEIFRALRHGVNQDGQTLVFMSLLSTGEISDADLAALIASRARGEQTISEQNARMETLPSVEVKLLDYQRLLGISDERYRRVRSMLDDLKNKTEVVARPAVTLGPAAVPEKPVAPDAMKLSFIGLLAGLCVGLIFSFGLESLKLRDGRGADLGHPQGGGELHHERSRATRGH